MTRLLETTDWSAVFRTVRVARSMLAPAVISSSLTQRYSEVPTVELCRTLWRVERWTPP